MSIFKSQRVMRSYIQRIEATPDRIFPLLDPVREKEWLDGWEYEMIYSNSGLGENGCVFKTHLPHEPETIWMITRRDEVNYRIEFIMLTPGSRIGRLQIDLQENDNSTTSAHISYTFTALSEQGNVFINNYTDEDFRHRMQRWEQSMNHFLTTGKLLKTRQ